MAFYGILSERPEHLMCDKPVVKQVSRFQGCVLPGKWSPQSSCGYDMPWSLPPELGCFPVFICSEVTFPVDEPFFCFCKPYADILLIILKSMEMDAFSQIMVEAHKDVTPDYEFSH